MNKFYKGKKVFVTGHTGFKGSWLTLWLQQLGAEVYGFSNTPNSSGLIKEKFVMQDVRDARQLDAALDLFKPDIVFHLAAQPIVSVSYQFPKDTFETNVLGTVNLLNSLRLRKFSGRIMIVTSDKVYQPKYSLDKHAESDELGGDDPYSLSKACSELAVKAYRACDKDLKITTLRAGNVIGGGDWSKNRIVPDCVNCFRSRQPIVLRKPNASRPFQHVLDCLRGYLMAGAHGYQGALNFGPENSNTVLYLAELMLQRLGGNGCEIKCQESPEFSETEYLDVDSSLANRILGWSPLLSFEESVEFTANWYLEDSKNSNMREYSIGQIEKFCAVESNWLSNLTP